MHAHVESHLDDELNTTDGYGRIVENRRKLERYKMNLLAFVKVDGGEKEGIKIRYMVTANICAGGVYLRTDAPLAFDTRVHIGFFIPTPNPLNPELSDDKIMSLVETTGCVIRCEDKGMAIQFDKDYTISPLLKKRRREACAQ